MSEPKDPNTPDQVPSLEEVVRRAKFAVNHLDFIAEKARALSARHLPERNPPTSASGEKEQKPGSASS